jgi:hypothetical protein
LTTSQNHFETRFGVAFARFESNFMNTATQSKRGVEAARTLLSEATLLFDESHALSYAVVMALAQTPRNKLSRQEIDGLCQLAYELLNKLNRANNALKQTQQKLLEAAAG